jgi:hypothetical protein
MSEQFNCSSPVSESPAKESSDQDAGYQTIREKGYLRSVTRRAVSSSIMTRHKFA